MSDRLPMLGRWKTWAIEMHPGGRRYMKQIEPSQISSIKKAINTLRSGGMVYVWPSEADSVWQQYQRGRS